MLFKCNKVSTFKSLARLSPLSPLGKTIIAPVIYLALSGSLRSTPSALIEEHRRQTCADTCGSLSGAACKYFSKEISIEYVERQVRSLRMRANMSTMRSLA